MSNTVTRGQVPAQPRPRWAPSAHLKKVEHLKTSFRRKRRKNGNPKILPERPKPIRIIRRLRDGSIPAHTAAYGSLRGPISHLLIFRYFFAFSRQTFRFSEIQRTPPKSSRRLRTHPFHHTLTIRTHPDPFERIMTQDRAHQAPLTFHGVPVSFFR